MRTEASSWDEVGPTPVIGTHGGASLVGMASGTWHGPGATTWTSERDAVSTTISAGSPPSSTSTDTRRSRPGTWSTAPQYVVRDGSDDDLAEGFAIAGRLADDRDPTVHKAVGIFLKHAGARAPDTLRRFLARQAAAVPRPALHTAGAKLDPGERARDLA